MSMPPLYRVLLTGFKSDGYPNTIALSSLRIILSTAIDNQNELQDIFDTLALQPAEYPVVLFTTTQLKDAMVVQSRLSTFGWSSQVVDPVSHVASHEMTAAKDPLPVVTKRPPPPPHTPPSHRIDTPPSSSTASTPLVATVPVSVPTNDTIQTGDQGDILELSPPSSLHASLQHLQSTYVALFVLCLFGLFAFIRLWIYVRRLRRARSSASNKSFGSSKMSSGTSSPPETVSVSTPRSRSSSVSSEGLAIPALPFTDPDQEMCTNPMFEAELQRAVRRHPKRILKDTRPNPSPPPPPIQPSGSESESDASKLIPDIQIRSKGPLPPLFYDDDTSVTEEKTLVYSDTEMTK